jgi:hypothetical protein
MRLILIISRSMAPATTGGMGILREKYKHTRIEDYTNSSILEYLLSDTPFRRLNGATDFDNSLDKQRL